MDLPNLGIRRVMPPTKISQLRECMAAGRWEQAFRIAAKFPRLGSEKTTIERAHQAYAHPMFCKQTGRKPEALIAAGIAALQRRYGR